MGRSAPRIWSSAVHALIAGLAATFVFGFVHAVASGAQAPARAPEPGTVWDGVFTEEQARRGGLFYGEHCAGCHGVDLKGGENRALTGDRFWASWQDTTVDALLTHVSTNMPHSEDGSLKGTLGAHVYADVVAHILHANAFPAGARELTRSGSAGIRIVRQEGPGELPDGSFAHVVGCLAPRGADRNWRLSHGSAPARVLEGREVDLDVPIGDREYVLRFVITSLDKFVGHRVSVRASLMGAGGTDGLNVSSVTPLADSCP